MDKENRELQRRLQLVKQMLSEGRLHVREGLGIEEAFSKLRYLADGTVDLDSVEPEVRAIALAVAGIDADRKLREIPLKTVHEAYFGIVESVFEELYKLMLETKVTPHQFASFLSTKQEYIKQFSDNCEHFEEIITNFWKEAGPVVDLHIRELTGVKAIYGGDILPNEEETIVAEVGLYLDTIVLPDPLLRVSSFFRFMSMDRAFFYYLKYGLTVLKYKSAALTDLEYPFVIISPDKSLMQEHEMKYISTVGNDYSLYHCSKIFGRNFEDATELEQFLKSFHTYEDFISSVVDPTRLLLDSDWKELDMSVQLGRAADSVKEMRVLADSETTPWSLIQAHMLGRMMQATDFQFRADKLRGMPILSVKTSWQYYTWKNEYDSELSDDKSISHDATQLVDELRSKNLGWLGSIPLEVVISLREQGILSKLRASIRSGMTTIELADSEHFRQTALEVSAEINSLLDNHVSEVENHLGESKKYLTTDVAPWLVTGGLSLAAVLTHNVPIGVLALGARMIGCPNAKELWKRGRELLADRTKLRRSPIAMLLDLRNSS